MKFEEEHESIRTFTNRKFPVIYFLLDGEDVVYVGQSVKGLQKIYHHPSKVYDSIKVMPIKGECIHLMDEIEDGFIMKYKPKYNRRRNPYFTYTLRKVKEELIDMGYETDMREIKRGLMALNIEPEADPFSNRVVITQYDFWDLIEWYKKGGAENE